MLTAQWKNFRRVQDSHLVPLFSEQECVSSSVLSGVAHVPQKPELYRIFRLYSISLLGECQGRDEKNPYGKNRKKGLLHNCVFAQTGPKITVENPP